MKTLLSTIILWTGFFLSAGNLNAQSSKVVDSLNVYNQKILYAQVATPKIQNLAEREWKLLITSFRTHLKSIQSQIPDYLIYKISYIKDVNLQVEEVEGMVKYQVDEGGTSLEFNQNVAILQHENLKIYLYFNKLEDLFSEDYETMIGTAFSKMKKTNFLKQIYFPYDQYFYSYSDGKMINNYNQKPLNKRIGLGINGSIGIYKNAPIYELDLGPALVFGSKNQRVLFGIFGLVYQFEKASELHRTDIIVGIGYKPNRFGSVSIAFPIAPAYTFEALVPVSERELIYEDVMARLAVTVYSKRGLVINGHLFFRKDSGFSYPGISAGFGL